MINTLLHNQFLLAAKELANYDYVPLDEVKRILAKYGLYINNMTSDELVEIQRLIEEFRYD